MNGKTNLITEKKLVKPIEQALERIENIRQRKINNVDSIILEGLFALAVASFEHSLGDTMRELFTHIPDKMDIKNEVISKKELIDGNPLKQAIENKVNAVSYKNLSEILTYFAKITDIPETLISEEELNSLLEIKATRNLLIHNNLMVNSIYKETAGVNVRAQNGRLSITQDYLFESLVTIRSILEKFHNAILVKYADFTKVKAVQNLFDYIFKTPVMDFDHEFEVDIESDKITNIRSATSYRDNLSSSERFFFDVWIAHTHGKSFNFDGELFLRLDKSNIKKMAYLIENIDLLKT